MRFGINRNIFVTYYVPSYLFIIKTTLTIIFPIELLFSTVMFLKHFSHFSLKENTP